MNTQALFAILVVMSMEHSRSEVDIESNWRDEHSEDFKVLRERLEILKSRSAVNGPLGTVEQIASIEAAIAELESKGSSS